ncbi:acVLRF1 family peptidyl-tRNA hydrolase [Aestuariimicrobium ganziense]|uniref:acVLRF1 family peptidyl-tRNA hydrolase n=1 Tax=Aestuariimicrobium ganziense TaxID=2773677 RepID=UPI002E2E0C26|nr:acVLRF1 family peptidyl-tRNA hydrolase [Aestuariimicrobium ganziense]
MPPDHPRRVSVSAERLTRWVAGYAQRHGDPIVQAHPEGWELVAPDGAVAVLRDRWNHLGRSDCDDLEGVVAHLIRDRTLGLVLVRKGAHAVGIAQGARLVESKIDTHYVQGRTKAGGWSQQRYARRRDNQAAKAFGEAATEVAVRLLPVLEELDAVVCGGDRRAVDEVFADPRLEVLEHLRHDVVLPTKDPRLAVLEAFVEQARATTIDLNEFA